MIYIYTETFCLWPRLKYYIKVIMGRQNRGPKAVEDSLMRGLKKLGVEFKLNRKITRPIDTACVLSGAGTLRWLIKQKQAGKIKTILAGPIISVTPLQHDGLVTSAEVNAFVVPSLWVKDWWGSLSPAFYDRIKLWSAGVEDSGELGNAAGKALVFQKNAPEELLTAIIKVLDEKKIDYEIIRYGNFVQQEYFRALGVAKFVIYLSQSESQGLALQEAWIRNVPSMVWNRGYLTYQNLRWEDPKISAPLMTDQCGKFFKDENDFSIVLQDFLQNYANLEPRQYSLEHFTDEVCAKQYLNIIKQLNEA